MMLPRRVKVKNLLAGRYQFQQRPTNWNKRQAGEDEIMTEDGEKITLYSRGDQSSPAAGWEILLTKQVETTQSSPTFTWTLFGISPRFESARG